MSWIRRHIADLGQVGLLLGLLAWLFTVYQVVRSALSAQPPGSRIVTLALYDTSDAWWLAITLAVTAVACVGACRWFPAWGFVGVVVSVLWLSFAFPLLVDAAAVTTVMITLAGFWGVLRSTRRWHAAVYIVAAIVTAGIATVPMYAINEHFQAFSGSGVSTMLSVMGTAQAVFIATAGMVASVALRRANLLGRELAASNAELFSQREAVAAAAVLGERIRIARELHDVVAHHVTTMTVHAGIARSALATQPCRATDAISQIEQSGRDAISELGNSIGLLRADAEREDDRTPSPSLRQIERLTGAYPSLDVDLVVEGDLTTVPHTVDLSAYRIVQEALTNVVKHSSSTSATVSIKVGDDHLDLGILNLGTAVAPSDNGTRRTGHGLLGLRERVALFGGSVDVGPHPGGGWHVAASIPIPSPVKVPRTKEPT